jgi:tetratricopeptide (TPR) repeat protein
LTKKNKLHPVETALFVLVILLLCVGTYSRNRIWNDEISLWTDCVNKSPHKSRPYLNLGVAYFDRGAFDKAFEATQKAVQLDPKNGEAYYNLGLDYQKMGNLKEAIAMEKRSLELDPNLMMPYYSLGGIYFESGQYEESEEAFQRFLKIYPYFPEVHNLLAIDYAAQKKFDKAVTELEWEIRINPNHTLAHLNLGLIYWHEFQNRQKALSHLKRALVLDPLIPNRAEILQLVRLLEGFP